MENSISNPADSKPGTVVHVAVREAGRRKKRSSSRGTRRLTDIDKRVSKAVRRVTRALDHGVDSYMDHRDRSREKRRDGAVVDFAVNVSHGFSKALSEASPLVTDVTKAWTTNRLRRQIRSVARTFGSIPFFG